MSAATWMIVSPTRWRRIVTLAAMVHNGMGGEVAVQDLARAIGDAEDIRLKRTRRVSLVRGEERKGKEA